nr:unnamed protein product [Spirometra erinaceieuropaei]
MFATEKLLSIYPPFGFGVFAQALEECLRLLPNARELSDHTGNATVTSANARAEDVGMSDFLKTMDLPVSFLVDLIRPNFAPTDDASSAEEGEAAEAGGEARPVLAAQGGSIKEVTAPTAEQGQTIRMRFKAIKRRHNLGSARLFRQIISHSDLDQVIKTSLPAPENVPSPEDEPKSKPAAMAQTNCRKDLLRNLVETVVEQSRSAKKDADLNREYIAILENLSKQAEDVCQSVICSGGLDSLLYACRSEDPEILKHAVFALANLTIHGGESSQIELVKQHAVEWLFPIALHNNELLRYYAFLTLLLLLVNKDLMPTVANSELLGLFVPFVNSHNPIEFTKESQLDEIIFSREWMSRLLPALTIDRREAQALAVFHFVAAITSAGNSLEKFCPDAKKLASLLKVHLELRGYRVFLDIERLTAGRFDLGLINSITMASNFILVLTPNALDRCLSDKEGNDWVHKEITCALENRCNIIPLTDRFDWPAAEDMPEDIRNVIKYNSVNWIHDYQEACIDKLEKFMKRNTLSHTEASPTNSKTSMFA